MSTMNLCCCSVVTTPNPAALDSCKFISKFSYLTAIPFASFHFSTKLQRNHSRNFHLQSQRSASSLEAETAEELEVDYDDPTTSIRLHRSGTGNECLKQPQSSNFVIMAAALTVGVAVLLIDQNQKAMALGPEGPLAEEFWENMRRYALYALTVSSGVAYAVFQPIYELLRNPISAILVIAIAAGGIYFVSQVLSAMVGVSDFTYDYSY